MLLANRIATWGVRMQMQAPAFNIPHLASTEKQLLKHKMVILFSEYLALRVIWSVTSLLLKCVASYFK